MAEFKLGRIRFVWQGDWADATSYVVDDVVRVGGNSYICVRNHTSSALFETDLNFNPTYWNLVSGGLEWKGDWTTNTYYNIGDQVKYGGVVYICTDAHTSAATATLGLEADQSKWDALAATLNWTGDWAINTRYRVNDLVVYGGVTYLCNTYHTSAGTEALGLEDDLSSWDVFNAGLIYLGVWTDGVRYRVNDIVKYGAGTWICTTYHTSTTTFDVTKWDTFVEGLQFEDSWSSSSVYQIGDVVTYGGYTYIAKQNHSNQNPSTETAYWGVYTTGFNFSGDWSSATDYQVGDVVRVGGYTYVAILDSTNQTPPNSTYWSRLNQGLRWADNSETYLAVTTTTLTGSGIGATFDVVRSGTVYSVTIDNAGGSYAVTDTLKILGTDVGGASPVNDITLTVSGTSSGAITGVNIVGNAVTWTENTAYVLGDLVFWGASTYICVEAHVAIVGNRPDNDTTAIYWNLFAAGTESSVLTVAGDTYYYGENGPTRLPVGADGTVLRVRSGYPEWAYYGVVNNLVYVAPSGTDSTDAGWGLTIDKPWRTVRFACEQIEGGYRNRNAKALLEKNKLFIMKEVTNWILFTYSVNILSSSNATNYFECDDTSNLSANMPIEFDGTTGGVTAGTKYFVKDVIDSTHFTISATAGGITLTLTTGTTDMVGVLSYDRTVCERDTGYLVDAVIYDLSHGGNEESTKAAKAYYTTAGTNFITSNFGQQTIQTVAAYNFLKDLVAGVINGTANSATYQGLYGVGPSDRAEPITDSTLVAEAGTATEAQALLTIVTDGIESGVVTSIPTAVYSNTTISVKTGTYFEVLPIVIPKNTAVVGDELRSSVISPKPAIANLVNDKPKTVSALNRIKALLPNLLANNTVEVTAGNTETQQYIFGLHESITEISVTENTDTIKNIIENGLTVVPAFTFPQPDDFASGYKNAVLQLQQNKEFVKAEITAWIAVQKAGNISPFTSGFTYDAAACARDVGYIVDALQYDLTYGGNLATIEVARAYFSNGSPVYGAGEKEETLASYAYLKSIIDNIVTATSFTKSSGNALNQDTSTYGAGSAGSATDAQARVQEIYDAINADGTLPSTSAPSTTWVNTKLTQANSTVQSLKETIKSKAITWVTTNFPDLVFDQALCSRDVGYIVDALCYDFMFKSNYRSVKAGMAYRRGLASTLVVTTNQLDATLGIVNFIREQIIAATAGTDMLTSNINTMTDILANGLTAVPSYVFTTPTAGAGSAYESGYYNAARLVLANKAFLQAEVTAWINVQIAGPVAPFSGFVYDPIKCERDVGYVVDALNYDLTYGGNLATQIAARSYYSNGVLVEVGEEAQALALWAYVKTIIDDIAKGIAITPSSGNVVSQVTSGTAGSVGAGTFAQARIQELYDTIDTGTEPTTIAPSTSWVHADLVAANTAISDAKTRIQAAAIAWVNANYSDLVYDATTCSRDVGYIVDALRYDLMFESNFLSSWNAMSYHRGITSTDLVLNQQLQPSLGIIGYVGAAVKELAFGKTGVLGNTVAIDRIERSANTIYDVLNNGINSAPAEILTNPSTLATVNLNARTQIANNYAFIKADVSRYIQNNYPAIWTALGATGQAACQRDIGYVLDAIRYDLTYGGNTQTVVAGRAYYSGLDLTFDSTELTATLAAYTHLKSIIDDIAQRLSVTPQSGNTTPQNLSGTGGDAGVALVCQALVDDVIYWITNGENPTITTPNLSALGLDAGLIAGFNELQDRKAEIQSDALAYVRKFFQSLTFDEATCSRDVGYMVDAIGYDVLFNSNFASSIAGKSYHRAIASTAVVLASQKDASLGLIKFLKYKLKGIATGGAVAQVGAIVDDVVGTIYGGAVPRFLWPDYTGIDAENFAAAKLIWENTEFLVAETHQYIYDNYPAIEYSKSACGRDVGYIIDALRYDMIYGGNFASKQAGIAYYSRLTSALQIDSADKAATLAAYANLKTAIQDIANGGLSSYTALQSNVSYITGTGGDAASATRAGALMDVITNIIDTGLTTGVPRITITTIAGGNTFTSTGHGLSVGDEVIAQTTANGLVAGTTYYVKSTPLTSTFTLAATYDGTEITTFTNGTGLSIAVEITNLPGTSWVTTNLVGQNTLLSSNKATIQAQVISYITDNYPNLDYNSTTCSRDVGYIIDAIRYDLMMGSNFRSVKAGMSYYQAQASLVVGAQKRATIQAFRYMKSLVANVIDNNADAKAYVKKMMTIIINIIDKGVGETPEVNGTLSYMNNIGVINSAEILRANKTFLEDESTAWIRSQFGGSVTATTASTNAFTTTTSHNLSIGDPVVFTSDVISTLIEEVSSTGNLVTLRTTQNIVPNMQFVVTGTGLGNVVVGTYYVKTVVDSTTVTISTSVGGSTFNPGNATGLATAIIGGVWGGPTIDVQYYVYSIPSTTTFTVATTPDATAPISLTDATGVMSASYSFDEASCKRDMRAYIDGIVYDLNWAGNYKSTRAAVLYNNAVKGSEMSDMFHVSNATGLRNCTLRGLEGDLSDENDYGTKRPTAGAYVALNPGFGPNDSKVWVLTRSHYSQNVTMFGYGCVGAKIDSSLHAGGNKSMVKNDFTTILGDGIGVWCTGADSLTELVSVFAYYSYAGYLAELGGRIRATNGNSSYGVYGVIAEGVDSQEVPLYGRIDNRGAQAQITNTVTDGVMEVLRFEFGNAGTNYTNTVHTINGSGYNANAIGDEFRDGAVFETRIIDLDNGDGVGGTSYVTAANAAQTGDTTSITIAATDQALSAAYVGMRVQITAGTGVGQYANILTYNTGSKIATVFKDSFTTLTATATTTSTNLVTVNTNATLFANMPIYFTGTTVGGITANTLYYVKALTGTTQFTISTTPGGTAVALTTASGSFSVIAAGWDHVVPGTAIENALDLTTTYIIEPRINYSAPGYTATARTLSATATWKDIAYGDNKYVAIANGSTSTSFSANGTTWASAGAMPSTATWTDVVYGGGEGATATVIVGGIGGRGAILTAVLGVANTTGAPTEDQVASVTIVDGGQGYDTPPVIVFTPVSGGTGAVATCTVLNGAIATITVTVPGSGYNVAPTATAKTDRVTDIIVNDWGKNYFSDPSITIDDPFTGTAWSSGGTVALNDTIYYTNTTVSPNRKNWYQVTTGGTLTTTGPTHTSGTTTNGTASLLYIGTTAVATPSRSNYGVSSFTINYSGSGYTTTPNITILDTGARYVAIANGSTSNAYTTRAGIAATSAWTAGSALPASDFVALTYGNGVYVAVGGTASAASSGTGSLWQTRTIPSLGSGTYSAVAFGNGTFVAISTGNVATAVSSNGNSWSAGGNLPSSTTWSSIAYGNGRFVALATGTRSVAVSTNKGTTWTEVTPGLPSTQTWTRLSYGQGLFFAISSGSSVAATSPDGVTWTVRAMPSSSNWNAVEFGNISGRPLWVAASNTSGTVGASIRTGAQALGRVKVASGVVTEVRMVEPGSGYPYGTVSATATSDLITVDNTTNLADSMPVEFYGTSAGGLVEEQTYYVIGSTITSTQFKVSATAGSATAVQLENVSTITGMTYRAGPVVTVTDPNKVKTAALRVRLGDGALGNPSFSDRGADNATATSDTSGDGYSDLYQVSTFVNVYGLSEQPTAGANVEFASIPGEYYKLVTVTNYVEDLDNLGTYKATFQINPSLTTLNAPRHGDLITTRIKYSQVRLTGHDYLYIGTGNQTQTNYPNVDISTAIQANQELFTNGGRVFFTSTDQDGNFNVGNLFGVQQATGTATLNASAFNLSGLNSLQLGSVELGIGSAVITQFSTDPFFTADSDNVVPTQRAIRAYITAQIGGGQSSLNVNTLTSGVVYIAGNSISTTTGEGINVTSRMNFTGGIDGAPVALAFFMQR